MKDENIFTGEKKEAKFNAGIAKLERIHKLRIGCHENRLQHNWIALYDVLLGLRSEINDRMNNVEKEKADYYQREIVQAFQGKRASILDETVRYGHYRSLLYSYELFLCALIEKFGMGMVDKEGVTDSISQME